MSVVVTVAAGFDCCLLGVLCGISLFCVFNFLFVSCIFAPLSMFLFLFLFVASLCVLSFVVSLFFLLFFFSFAYSPFLPLRCFLCLAFLPLLSFSFLPSFWFITFFILFLFPTLFVVLGSPCCALLCECLLPKYCWCLFPFVFLLVSPFLNVAFLRSFSPDI